VTSHVTLRSRPRKGNHENTKARKTLVIVVTSHVTLRSYPRKGNHENTKARKTLVIVVTSHVTLLSRPGSACCYGVTPNVQSISRPFTSTTAR
jgi:hypothetical protein